MTMLHNFKLLDSKVNALRPNLGSRHKRGLLNIIGKGLKYLTGTMDSDDEELIKTKLDNLSKNNHDLITEANKQISINHQISDLISNITTHINNQQKIISNILSNYTNENSVKINNLQIEIQIIQQIYQLNYDINLLQNHIDDIEQIILTSKLNILSRNILTEEELKLISNPEDLQDIKIVVVYYTNQIIIIILIPLYSTKKYSSILIEPLPNPSNKSLVLEDYTIILDEDEIILS